MSGTIDVRAYLNTTRDDCGIPLGMLSGYIAGHELTLAFETTFPATADDLSVCEQVFHLLNVGHEPEFGTPDPRATAYRDRGNRSMSVGDVVSVDSRFYACARFGFTPIDAPDSIRTSGEQGQCWSGFCIASFCDGIHHVDATGYTWTEARLDRQAAAAAPLTSSIAHVAELPMCDLHPTVHGSEAVAAYDGKTAMGPWAYLCRPCFMRFGVGVGTGRGQRLILTETRTTAPLDDRHPRPTF